MPAHRKLTDAGRARIEEVARVRQQTPSDKELALECGISPYTVRHVMDEYRNRAKLPDSRGTNGTPEEVADAIIREFSL